MRYAIFDGKRVEGISGAIGRCECCNADVQGCDGEFYRYWRHLNLADCDTWAEGETPWHRNWKERFKSSGSRDEITIREPGGPRGHRADILTSRRVVVELQHSFLNADELRAREDFYSRLTKGMVWLFDLTEKAENFERTPKDSYFTFRWKHMRLTSLACEFPRFVDLGNDQVFEIKKLYKGKAVHGWGNLHTYAEFIRLVTRRGQIERKPEQTQINPSRRERLDTPSSTPPPRPAPPEPRPTPPPPAPAPAPAHRPAPPAPRPAAPPVQPFPPARRQSWPVVLASFAVGLVLFALLVFTGVLPMP